MQLPTQILVKISKLVKKLIKYFYFNIMNKIDIYILQTKIHETHTRIKYIYYILKIK